MSDKPGQAALILGGAGFIGSQVATQFHDAGFAVTVLDGLMPRTGGNRRNLAPLVEDIEFIETPIESTKDLPRLVARHNIIVDCMAWTSHRLALADPLYDLRLNVEAHLHLIQSLQNAGDQQIILLGSRVQYGNPQAADINEETPMVPVDVQGINKLATESYFRVYSSLKHLNVMSLRVPNCFGENQPTAGEDIGLVGGFIQDILNHKVIKVYGGQRRRTLIYVKDLARIITQLSAKKVSGFQAFNVGGYNVSIEYLVKELIEAAGQGQYQIEQIPDELLRIDQGAANFNSARLSDFLGDVTQTELKTALSTTIKYFAQNLYRSEGG